MIEFAYNNNKHASIENFSFEIMQRYSSRMFFEKILNKKIEFKFAKKHVEHLIELFRILKDNLLATQTQQIKYKNVYIKFMKY